VHQCGGVALARVPRRDLDRVEAGEEAEDLFPLGLGVGHGGRLGVILQHEKER